MHTENNKLSLSAYYEFNKLLTASAGLPLELLIISEEGTA